MVTIQTSSIPDLIDWAVTSIRGITFPSVPSGAPVYVYDGLPDQPDNPPDRFVCVGGGASAIVTGGDRWGPFGAASLVADRDEEYEIRCWVSAYVGGSDATATSSAPSASNAQKQARDQAFAVYRLIEQTLRADPKAGTNIVTGWTSFGDVVQVDQTSYDSPEAGMGRVCTIHFTIGVYRRKRAV